MKIKKTAFLFLALILLSSVGCSGGSSFGSGEFKKELDALKVEYKVLDITNQDDFFTISPKIMEISGKRVYLYDFKSDRAMEMEAEKVDASGLTIGNAKISWTSTPHFYKKGSVIVQYVGNDKEIVDILREIMGIQFAGMG